MITPPAFCQAAWTTGERYVLTVLLRDQEIGIRCSWTT